MLQLLVTPHVCPSSLNFSEASVLRTTWHRTPEDGILHSHRYEDHKSYIVLTGWNL
jgi:hypothetical protein